MGPWPNRTPPIRGGVFTAAEATQPSEINAPEDLHVSDAVTRPVPPILVDADDTARQVWSSSLAPPSPTNTSVVSGGSFFRRSRGGSTSEGSSDDITDASSVDSESEPTTKRPLTLAEALTHPDKWTEWAIQQGQDKDLSEYPSVDVAVQQEITVKYRDLHQKVQNLGLYQCRYIEYGKEMIRYSAVFALFLYTLHQGWYIISACFLGLFWVSLSLSPSRT